MKFRQWLFNFMYGRNGIDSLNIAIAITALILSMVNLFCHSIIIMIIQWLLLILFLFRFFSRNTAKRSSENFKFQNAFAKAKQSFAKFSARMKDNKDHCFKRCPNCGKTLRLPRKRGRHNTRCPLCQCKFSVRIWFGSK
ncbi:MAG: hypothetical protein ACI4RN_08600 [Oscillospiraceae bacterium]